MVVPCNYQLRPGGGGGGKNVSGVSNCKYHYPLHMVAFSISLPDVTAKNTFLKSHPKKVYLLPRFTPPIKCFKCQPFSVMIFRLGHWKPFTNFLSNFPELLWTIFTFLYPAGWVYLLFVCFPSINVGTVLCGAICVCVSVALFCFVSECMSFAGLVTLLPARWAIHQNYPLPPKNAFVNSLPGRNCINLYYRIINFFFL